MQSSDKLYLQLINSLPQDHRPDPTSLSSLVYWINMTALTYHTADHRYPIVGSAQDSLMECSAAEEEHSEGPYHLEQQKQNQSEYKKALLLSLWGQS